MRLVNIKVKTIKFKKTKLNLNETPNQMPRPRGDYFTNKKLRNQ